MKEERRENGIKKSVVIVVVFSLHPTIVDQFYKENSITFRSNRRKHNDPSSYYCVPDDEVECIKWGESCWDTWLRTNKRSSLSLLSLSIGSGIAGEPEC